MKKFYKMFLYDFKMTMREKEALFWMFIFPVLMMIILGFVFGSSGNIVLDVGVVDLDKSPISEQIVEAIVGIGNQKDAPLDVETGLENAELAELRDGNRQGVLIIKEGFGEAIQQGQVGNITIYVDESNISTAQITRQTLTGIVNSIAQGMAGTPELIRITEKRVESDDFEYVDFMVPGILAMTIMFGGLMGFSQEIAEYREKGILRRVKVSPISLPNFIGSGLVTVLLLALVQAALLILVGVLAFKITIAGNYLYIAILVLIGAASFIAMGFLISSLAKTSKTATLVANAIAMPMMFLSGIFFSIEWVPRALSIIAQCLPLYYFGHALREVMIHSASLADVWVDILVMAVFGLVCFVGSVKFFRWE